MHKVINLVEGKGSFLVAILLQPMLTRKYFHLSCVNCQGLRGRREFQCWTEAAVKSS